MRIKKTSETRPLGATVVNAYDNSQINAYSAQYCNQAFGGTILWTNPNQTSSFAGQEIQVDFTNCDMYEIIYAVGTAIDRTYSSGKVKVGTKFNAFFASNIAATPSFVGRGMSSISSSSITFGGGYSGTIGNMTSANDTGIPLYVIGYKTGLFN